MTTPPWNWTADQDRNLRTWWRKRYSIVTIAERIGCTEGQVKQRRVTLNLPPRAVGNQRSSNRNESAANYWTAFESADRAFSAALQASAGEGFTDARVAPHSNVHRSYRDLPEAHGWRSPMADA